MPRARWGQELPPQLGAWGVAGRGGAWLGVAGRGVARRTSSGCRPGAAGQDGDREDRTSGRQRRAAPRVARRLLDCCTAVCASLAGPASPRHHATPRPGPPPPRRPAMARYYPHPHPQAKGMDAEGWPPLGWGRRLGLGWGRGGRGAYSCTRMHITCRRMPHAACTFGGGASGRRPQVRISS